MVNFEFELANRMEWNQTGLHFFKFFVLFIDHYVAVLVCQQKCLKKLCTFGMEELENFVQEHYNYLQYAYYEGNIK